MAATDNIFLDANIIMELHFGRRAWRAVLEVLAEDSDEANAISVVSVHVLLYYVERAKKSKQEVFEFLRNYQILNMNEADYEWAAANDQGDFEDALQVACALRHGCKKLITLDADLAKRHNKHIAVKLVR